MEWEKQARDGEDVHILMRDGAAIGEIYLVTGLNGEGCAWRGAIAQAPDWPGFFPPDDEWSRSLALAKAMRSMERAAGFQFSGSAMKWTGKPGRNAKALFVGRCAVASVIPNPGRGYSIFMHLRTPGDEKTSPKINCIGTLAKAKAWAEQTVRDWFAAAGVPLPEDRP